MSVTLSIERCAQCPAHRSEREYTADSFETEYRMHCDRAAGRVIGYHDWRACERNALTPPDWCPLRVKAEAA